jgi:hypothetical protein
LIIRRISQGLPPSRLFYKAPIILDGAGWIQARGSAVLWTIALAGTLGLLLGLRYKVASLIAASCTVGLVIVLLANLNGWGLGIAVLTILASLLLMQLMYMVGLLFARARQRPPGEPPEQQR